MKAKTFLIPFMAVLALFLVSFASASAVATIESVTFNDVEVDANGAVDIAAFAGEVVPVRVTFTANADSEDVRIRAEVYDGRDSTEDVTGRFNIVDGNVYTKLLSVKIPSNLDEQTKDLALEVKIFDANFENDNVIVEYVVKVQRESYEFDILSVDYDSVVGAGESVPVAVVIKNAGFERSNDGFVTVSVPALGISAKSYFGDLIPTEDYVGYEDEEDSVLRVLYLNVPESAAAGTYNVVVTAYDSDSETTLTRAIQVEGSTSSQALAAVKDQDMKAGETKTYELILVNSGNDVMVYNLAATSSSALTVSVPSVVTVGPDASQTVEVTVSSDNDAEVGTYTFTVSANGNNVVMTANVTDSGVSTSVVALTIILVIIFVVLLVILVILLSKKEKQVEEVETSYY